MSAFLFVQATLPLDRLREYSEEIRQLLVLKFCTLKEFQAVLGRLQWANMVISPSCPFLWHMIDGTKGVTDPKCHISLRKLKRICGCGCHFLIITMARLWNQFQNFIVQDLGHD